MAPFGGGKLRFAIMRGERHDFGQNQVQNHPSFVLDANARKGILPGVANPVTIAPAIQKILDLLPVAQASDSIGAGIARVNVSGKQAVTQNYLLGRVDWTIAAKDSLFVRYVNDRARLINPFSAGNINETGGGTAMQFQDPYNFRADYARSNFDRPHNLRINGIAPLPFKGNVFVEGWQISGITSAVSGYPFTVNTGFDRAGLGSQLGLPLRPNYVAGCQQRLGLPNRWFNPACYTIPGVGELGNLGRNTVTGPNLINTDISLTKDTKLAKVSEQFAIQFRVEVFNVFNHTNFGIPPNQGAFLSAATPTGAAPNPSAGVISFTSTSSRQIQLSLKLVF